MAYRMTVLFCAALLACVSAKPVSQENIFGGWKVAGPAPADSMKTMYLSLAHLPEDEQALHNKFVCVSDPDCHDYGNHLTKEELEALIPPAPNSVEATMEFCNSFQFECEVVGSGDVIKATATVAQVSTAFGIELTSFFHEKATQPLIRTLDDFEIPASISEYVVSVSALIQFPDMNFLAKVGAPQVTPQILRAPGMYNITEMASPISSKASQALVEFQAQGYLPSDLAKFESTFQLPPQPVRNCSGDPMANKTAGVEASLDVQYILATGTGVPTDFWLHPGNEFDVTGWATYVQGLLQPALVWSMSYGEGVNGGIGGVVPVNYVHQFNVQMEKLGARGISVFVASGDSGVYNREPFNLKFHPSFPACCPAVTAVGGTQLNEQGVEDEGWAHSGGGFTPANYFTRTNSTYQESAVQGYLSSGVELPPAKDWDKTGRAIPDVSALSVDYAVFAQGREEGVSGTSASTPVVAGIFSLVNNALMAAGKSPIGFANPLIYKNPQAFRDIVKGYNNNGGPKIFEKGFEATKGWDPVTGLGTPNYGLLKEAAMMAATKQTTHAKMTPVKVADEPRCCKNCTLPLVKYFSIVPLFGNCGESCIDPKDYNLYHLLEHNLTRAVNNSACPSRGYPNYTHTETHSFGPIHVAVDFFKKDD